MEYIIFKKFIAIYVTNKTGLFKAFNSEHELLEFVTNFKDSVSVDNVDYSDSDFKKRD
jgi:hypothetical protein